LKPYGQALARQVMKNSPSYHGFKVQIRDSGVLLLYVIPPGFGPDYFDVFL
jgi:hypothetical protein